MNHYLPKFRALMHQLHKNEHVVLLEYEEFEGIQPASNTVVEIEKRLGFKIPAAMLNFYTESDGLRLSWIHKKDDSYDPDKHLPFQPPTDLNQLAKKTSNRSDVESNHESGSINIRCLFNVLACEFEMNPHLYKEGYYVFDSFSHIHGAAISFPNSKEEAVVSFNSDYYTYFDDYSNAMGFTEYLDFLLQSKGVKTLRKNRDVFSLLEDDLKNWPEEFIFYEY